ncbi:MAG TPA: trigger factor [Pyrinomonadaceae bacterium]|jgi:trigger factor|nr:trigger factor [Pyrinomonadaceae bacterium]
MKTELVDISPTRKEIKIEIEAESLRAEYDRISDRYAKLANVPGFRRGHAPRSVVRTRFKDEIRGEVLRELVPQAIQEAISEHDLQVLGEPDVHLDNSEGLDKLGAEPLSVHVHVEVLPEVALGQYKGLAAARSTRPVTDEDIERVIEGLREASASLQPVEDRPSQEGDTVTVNFQGTFTGAPEEEPINVEEVDVVLGGEGVQQEFTDNLTGVQPDEVKTFTVRYPEDFTSAGLAGKEVAYTATVTAVRRKELPDVDDEWARSLGEEFDTVATLREKVREDLEKRAGVESDHRLRSAVMRKLVEAHPFEVPEVLIEHQTNQLLQSVMRDMMGRGIDPRQQQLNWEGVREQLRDQASADVRGSMLLDRIADEEKIEVTDEEIEAEIDTLAAQSRQSAEQVRAALTKQGGERSIADRLRNRKALDLIVENASVSEEEWRAEEEAEESDSRATPEAAAPDQKQEADEAGEEARAESSSSDASGGS